MTTRGGSPSQMARSWPRTQATMRVYIALSSARWLRDVLVDDQPTVASPRVHNRRQRGVVVGRVTALHLDVNRGGGQHHGPPWPTRTRMSSTFTDHSTKRGQASAKLRRTASHPIAGERA